jgi:hypothetical protein
MNRKTIYFFLGCVSGRGIIIYIAKTTWTEDLYFIGIFHILVATKFIYSDFLELTEYKPVFLKPIHALIYLAVAFFALRGYNDYVWKILVADLMFGIVMYTAYNILPQYSHIVCSDDKPVVLEV